MSDIYYFCFGMGVGLAMKTIIAFLDAVIKAIEQDVSR